MAYGVVHQFPGGTKAQYEASIRAVHPAHGGRPEGQIFHTAGPSESGWTIVAVHDSKESWERFRDATLMPTMQKGIDGGFATPPVETTFDVQAEPLTTIVVTHEVDDVDHWLHSKKREEVFGPMGITPRPFVDPTNKNRVGLIIELPDMGAFQAVMASDVAAAAMKHDGVRPETLVMYTAP